MKSIFGRSKRPKAPIPQIKTNTNDNDVFQTISKMKVTVEGLSKRQNFLDTKVNHHLQQAVEHKKNNRTNDALRCLKKKKMMEEESKKLVGMILNLEQQIMSLESSHFTQEMVDSQMEYKNAMKKIQANVNADMVAELQDDIAEQSAISEEVGELLAEVSNQFGDEDELNQELDAILNEGIEIPQTDVTSRTKITIEKNDVMLDLPEVPNISIPEEDEEDNKELDRLLAEMAMN